MKGSIRVTSEAILADMRRVHAELGGVTLTQKQYWKCGGGHAPSTINRRFGSWPDALRLAGIPVVHQRNFEKAAELMADLEPRPTTRRPCNLCGKPFPSHGFHNRRCEPCRSVQRMVEHQFNIEWFECA